MLRRPFRYGGVAVITGFALVASCFSKVEPLPLDLTLESNKSAPIVGDTVNFLARAQGNNLFGIEIVFGDGTGLLQEGFGARTITVTFKHAYQASGTFQVRATVTDATAGQKDANLQILVP